MPKVFVYETLKQTKHQEEALGHPAKVINKAKIPGLQEAFRHRDKETWPTLIAGPDHVSGEIILVSLKDLKKLDAWEDHYRRCPVITDDKETVWTYVLK